MLSRSTDRAVSNANKLPKRHDNKISEAILVENPSQVVLPVRPKSADRVSPDLVKHAKIHLGKSTEGSRPTNELVQDGVSKTKPSTIAKAHPERPKVKPVIVTPRKARTATNRGVQPLNIRKAMKTRAAAVAAAKAFPTQATTCANTSDAEELCEENPHDHLQGEQCIPSRTSQKTRENDLVACDPAQVPLPASPVMSANDSPGTDEGCMNDGGGSVLKSVHPSTPKKERKRMATVTPITRLAEQIRQGFDFTVCIDETLPYAPGDSDEAENELASVDFCGATTNSRKGAAEGRRVLCESNS
jgi:DNA-binding protein H-NS